MYIYIRFGCFLFIAFVFVFGSLIVERYFYWMSSSCVCVCMCVWRHTCEAVVVVWLAMVL